MERPLHKPRHLHEPTPCQSSATLTYHAIIRREREFVSDECVSGLWNRDNTQARIIPDHEAVLLGLPLAIIRDRQHRT